MATGSAETANKDENGEVEQPDLGKLEEALHRVEVRSVAITLLLVLAVFYTLYFARSFLLPVVFAILLDFLLSPIIRLLKRWRVPESVGAAIIVAGLLGAVAVGLYGLTEPARAWIAKAPISLQRVESSLQKLRKPVEQVSRTAEQVEEATKVTPSSGTQEVVVRGPPVSERIFGSTQALLTGALEMVVLLYFLLAAGDLFLEKLIKVLPQFRDKKKAVSIVRETEASISTYLLTVSLVNAGMGLVVTLAMSLVGMPNPLLWGALAAVAEFVPYLGATALVVTLSLAGIVTFPDLGHALLVPGAYLAVDLVQANFVTPRVLGRRLTLNPVAILLGLVFWWWLWGVGGAFVAVPLLATFKIFCDHIDTLAPIGEFLGE